MAGEVTEDAKFVTKVSPGRVHTADAKPQTPNTAVVMTTNPYRLLFRNKLDENRTVIAASSAAVCGVVAGFPFDSIKTRMQTHHYNSMFDCVHKTYIEEGFGGFFRGIIPPLITISIIKSISFSVYVDTKNYLSATTPGLDGTTLRSLMALSGIAGAASGAVIASLSCPLELVKIQKQLEQLLLTSSMATGGTVVRGQNGHVNRNALGPGATKIPVLQQQQAHGHGVKLTSSWHSAKEIARLKGISGLYKGFTLHLARDTLGTSVYFGSYETVKRLLTTPTSPAGPLTHFLAGGLCGIFCWLVVFPIDLVKSVIQKEAMHPHPTHDSIPVVVREILARSGYRGFYRGLGVTLMRAFPIHSLNFLVYEQVLKMISVDQREGDVGRAGT